MRISGGTFRGRTLATPRGASLRPTQDRVREALFSMAGPAIVGASFLDLFAGTGAVGLEALSRGAARAVFVERDPRHAEIAARNAAALLGAERARRAEIVRADAFRWAAAPQGETFDFCYADPPYATGRERGFAELMGSLAATGAVREGGFFAAEFAASQREAPCEVPGWTLFRDRRYGAARVCVWRRDTQKEAASEPQGGAHGVA